MSTEQTTATIDPRISLRYVLLRRIEHKQREIQAMKVEIACKEREIQAWQDALDMYEEYQRVTGDGEKTVVESSGGSL